MYEIMICPLKKLYMYASEGDMQEVAALAVSSYEINKEKLSGFLSYLCLNFDDVTSSLEQMAFSKKQAERIALYIKSLPQNTDTLFVCCDSGQSRSSAMAAAILRYNGRDDMKIWKNPQYHPNGLVYKMLCEALGVYVDDGEIAEKSEINRQAFSNAINR